ncbi:hypothetical protein [Aestuariimicrobium kwangyangense]|uniref:hypothetical protein n=1 Tax=Aestuariimicrobium kwangyangense TaxID=396389 RepID=UPI0003B3F4A8|nr:hypothetical protein [Aestuariimicrobium kwangyangense]
MAGTGLLVLALLAGLGVLLVLGVVLGVVTLTRRREPESYGEPSTYEDVAAHPQPPSYGDQAGISGEPGATRQNLMDDPTER